MPAQLTPVDEGVSLLLDKPILLIGRHPECDVQIESRKISRRHCCVAQVNDYLIIRDLGSTNGIRINGVRVVEGRLTKGDEVTIGNFRYQVTWGSSPDIEVPKQPPRDNRTTEPVREEHDSKSEALDVMLESSDKPIALPEPDDEAEATSDPLLELSEPAPPEELKQLEELEQPSSSSEEDAPPPSEVDPMSLIIPDALELAGSKDNVPKYDVPPGEEKTNESPS